MKLMHAVIPDSLYSEEVEVAVGLLCVAAVIAAVPLAVMGHPLRALAMVLAVAVLTVD